jgi:hypothetical protein
MSINRVPRGRFVYGVLVVVGGGFFYMGSRGFVCSQGCSWVRVVIKVRQEAVRRVKLEIYVGGLYRYINRISATIQVGGVLLCRKWVPYRIYSSLMYCILCSYA